MLYSQRERDLEVPNVYLTTFDTFFLQSTSYVVIPTLDTDNGLHNNQRRSPTQKELELKL